MSKKSWDRIKDTMKEIKRILGNEPFNHILYNRLPTRGTPAAIALSNWISLGKRGLFKKKSVTRLRHCMRAYGMVMILLENRNDVYVQQKLQEIKDNKTPLLNVERCIKDIWRTYNLFDLNALKGMTALSRVLNTFRNNPINFLRQYPVLPYDGDLPEEGNEYDLIAMDNSQNKPLILAMVLMPSGTIFHTYKLTKTPVTRRGVSIPIYFLPWKSARIVKLTIPAGNQGPSIFFTAGINGCSVFADGGPANPTLYHAGITLPWPNMDNTVSIHVRNAKTANNVSLTWKELFWDKSTNTARNGVGFGKVDKPDYINDGATAVLGIPSTPRALNFYNTISAINGWPASNINITNFFAWGCIFGIRTNQNWAFYLQENCTIYFSHTVGTQTNNYATSRLIRLKKFYPLPVNHYVPPNNTNAPTNFTIPNIVKLN